jgi:hypothetical protein
VVQDSTTRDIESQMLGDLDAGQSITNPGTSIVVKVCGLDSEAILAWGNRRTATPH